MDNLLNLASQNLGKNVEELRRQKGLSQAKLAQISGLPRSTLTYLESGDGNPSLQNLLKVAGALQVSINELLKPPHKEVAFIRAQDVPSFSKQNGLVLINKLLPDPIAGMEMDWLELKPGARMKGTPHLHGTKEYFTCFQGQIRIVTGGEDFTLNKGDMLTFPGNQAHAYINSFEKLAKGFSVVVFKH